MKNLKKISLFLVMTAILVFTSACGGNDDTNGENAGGGNELSGAVTTAGSSTVYPIMLGIAEEYRSVQPNVDVTVNSIGSGGGFKQSTKGDLDFSNASRPIKEEEKQIAEENGITLQEISLAYDGLTVAVSEKNDFVENLTIEELRAIFLAESGKTKWSEINPDWPDETIQIFAPGHDSGTFDYFNEVILEEKPMREDENVTLSEDDNILVRGLMEEKYSIGFFGYAYYTQNEGSLKSLGIDEGNGPVKPTFETIQSGEYSPLSRPLFTYVNVASLQNPQVFDFSMFVLDNAGAIAEEVGYVALTEEEYNEQKELLESLAE